MTRDDVCVRVSELFNRVTGNILSEKDKIKKKYIGLAMFDAPLIGIGSAEDELFDEYKKRELSAPGI